MLKRRDVRRAGTTDVRALEVELGRRVVDVTCIHFGGKQPFCVEERPINLANVPEAESADLTAAAPGRWLLGQVLWSTAERKFRAVAASADMANMLSIAKGSA